MADEDFPGLQLVQLEAPTPLYEPVPQVAQVLSDCAENAPEDFPAAQLLQVAKADSEKVPL